MNNLPEINGVMLPFLPAGGINELKKQTLQPTQNRMNTSFEEIFRKELDNLKFSSHAQSRMTSREIDLGEEDLNRLTSAVAKADEKGSTESLVMLNEKAFIVSVPNKTVITVVDSNDMENRVITNIVSVVFA
ncbi:MAG: flagellar protein [Ignavibacteriae bacterium]|nr:flagellar protein [Ignavibacteriota bacterium]